MNSEGERRQADREPDPVDGRERCDGKRTELQSGKAEGHGWPMTVGTVETTVSTAEGTPSTAVETSPAGGRAPTTSLAAASTALTASCAEVTTASVAVGAGGWAVPASEPTGAAVERAAGGLGGSSVRIACGDGSVTACSDDPVVSLGVGFVVETGATMTGACTG